MGTRRILIVSVGVGLALSLTTVFAAAAPGNLPAQATLVRTFVFHQGPPVVDARGKPQPAVANCSPDAPSGTTPAYTGFTSTGVDRVARFNAATTPAGLTTAAADLQAAFNAWSVSGEPNAPTFSVTTTGPLVKAPTANRHTDLMFGRAQGSAIAVTYTWQWSDTGEYESDTIFNNRLAWAEISTAGPGDDGCNETVVRFDLQNIATHEFGHTYGLDHPPGDRYATMYAYGYTGETLKRTLATSDAAGIQALY